MRVLVDTSAWVDFLNGYASPERHAVGQLLLGQAELCTCGVVVAEVLQGLRRDKSRREIGAQFRNLVWLEAAGIETYEGAADLYREMRARGVTVRSTIDCLIAVLADTHGCYVLARDRDLNEILDSGLMKKARRLPA
jgi:predicted nucleic acid-binding protein